MKNLEEKIKKAREKMVMAKISMAYNRGQNLLEQTLFQSGRHVGYDEAIDDCLSILDKVLEESEEENE